VKFFTILLKDREYFHDPTKNTIVNVNRWLIYFSQNVFKNNSQ